MRRGKICDVKKKKGTKKSGKKEVVLCFCWQKRRAVERRKKKREKVSKGGPVRKGQKLKTQKTNKNYSGERGTLFVTRNKNPVEPTPFCASPFHFVREESCLCHIAQPGKDGSGSRPNCRDVVRPRAAERRTDLFSLFLLWSDKQRPSRFVSRCFCCFMCGGKTRTMRDKKNGGKKHREEKVRLTRKENLTRTLLFLFLFL